MLKRQRINKKIKTYWSKKLDLQDDRIDQLAQQSFFGLDCSSSPQMLVALSSLSLAQKPLPEVIRLLHIFYNECTSPVFNEEYYCQLELTIREFERHGLRSHVRNLRKLGSVIAAMHNEDEWISRWAHDANWKLKSAIKDEPFLPQPG